MPQRLPGESRQSRRLFLETLEERCVLSGSFVGPVAPIPPPLPLVQATATLIQNIDQVIQHDSPTSQDEVPSLLGITISLPKASEFGKPLLVDTINDLFALPTDGLPAATTENVSHYTLGDNVLSSMKISPEVRTEGAEDAAILHQAIFQNLEHGTLLSALDASIPNSYQPLLQSDNAIAIRIEAFFKEFADGSVDDLPGYDAAAPSPPRPDHPEGGGFVPLQPAPMQQTGTVRLGLDDYSVVHAEQLLAFSHLGAEAVSPYVLVKAASSATTAGDKLSEDWFRWADMETSPLGTSHLIGLADFVVQPESSTPEEFEAAPLLQGWLQAQGDLVDLDQALRDFLNEIEQLRQEMSALVCSPSVLSWALAGTAVALTLLDQVQRWRQAQLRRERLLQAIDQPHHLGDLIVGLR
jgi:hypothetical protein